MSTTIFAGSALVLYAAIAAVLVQKYRRTRDAGFIWLGVAVIIWPLVSNLIGRGERAYIDRLVRQRAAESWPFTLGDFVFGVAAGRQLIGLILLLVAIAYLRRANGHAVMRVS